MSSMAPVYRGEVFGKQIYTMHSTVVYTHLYMDIKLTSDMSQRVVGDKNSSTLKCGLRMHVAGWDSMEIKRFTLIIQHQ